MPMHRTIATIAKTFVNILYPLRCASCNKDLETLNEFHVCGVCMSAIKPNPQPYCISCGHNMRSGHGLCADCLRARPYFEKAYSACVYETALKELIHSFKYKQKVHLAPLFAKLMADFVKEHNDIMNGVDMITFVPLHPRRLWEREFNQSKVLALSLAKAWGISLADTLEKTRATRPQNELSRKERLTNLANAFRAKRSAALKDKKILLIDDVFTTGATVNECSKVLRASGAAGVRCLTLARGM
jgi:competence protein ComFC